MRIAVINSRVSLITGAGPQAASGSTASGSTAGAVDVHAASEGRFGPDAGSVYENWAEFTSWAAAAGLPDAKPFSPDALNSPSPAPRQVFGIGLNYSDHVAESGLAKPETAPPVFTKFASCITGPYADITLPPGGHTDWEVELVVIIGVTAVDVPARFAWAHVAGVSAGQDVSERILQLSGTAPQQFSMGKSFPGFGPIGPYLVTPDELADPDNLELGCSINGDQVQKARTSEMIFKVPELIEQLSRVTPLLPGDVIFTGTPSGVGLGRTPQRWLAPGDVLTTYVEGIGEMSHRFVEREEA